MKIIILGASGVIGQYLRLSVPPGVEPVWARHEQDRMHRGIELNEPTDNAVFKAILEERPAAVVNLAGQSDVDTVGRDPESCRHINSGLPAALAEFCQRLNIHYVHVSSQAVFDGEHPPYHENSQVNSVNAYGHQKIEAEQRVRRVGSCWTIVRPSFVLGVRPMPRLGRKNPAEQMADQTRQVADRWFTACMAEDVASALWGVAIGEPQMRVIHVAGTPRISRHDLAVAMGIEAQAACHDDFAGLSPRPVDTTFSATPVVTDVQYAMRDLAKLNTDAKNLGPLTRAREISLFTGRNEYACRDALNRGFSELHENVSKDFRAANPKNDDELLEWYRGTESYIWELTAYHLDAGFNYAGMCRGVAETLAAKLANGRRVLVIGDGIGDMTLTLLRAGLDAVYHDLQDSATARFAQMRLWMHEGHECEAVFSDDWNPPSSTLGRYDAICAADFMEHLPNVEKWVRWIFDSLRPGGLLFAQNAFACGSGPDGGMPMHLARNDRFEKDWDPLLESVGFRQISSNWYKKVAVEPFDSTKTV